MVVLVLVGCGGSIDNTGASVDATITDEQAHTIGVCGAGWADKHDAALNSITQCELACADYEAVIAIDDFDPECFLDKPPVDDYAPWGPGRHTEDPNEVEVGSPWKITFSGHPGACDWFRNDGTAHFIDCKPN